MHKQTKVTFLIAAVLTVALAALAFVVVNDADNAPAASVDIDRPDSTLVRDDSRLIGPAGSSGVTFVEFLDFECEACGASFPVVEELRAEYAGEVTFIARYFPLPGHFNAERAARAVESAARQDKFEEMYQRMYETQAAWGEQQRPLDHVFRGYAEDLGLDMAEFDEDYASDEVADRVQKDVDDGTELGVASTPTFYIDGELFEPQTVEDFYTALDEALGR